MLKWTLKRDKEKQIIQEVKSKLEIHYLNPMPLSCQHPSKGQNKNISSSLLHPQIPKPFTTLVHGAVQDLFKSSIIVPITKGVGDQEIEMKGEIQPPAL